MSEEHLSGEEKRRAMKEQFKKELRERQAFAEKILKLRNEQKISQALQNMKVEDDTDEWIRKLNEESAFHEAKMEMALESANEKSNLPDQGEEMTALHTDDDLQKSIAEEMVKKLKEDLGKEQINSLNPPIEPIDDSKPPRNMI